MTTTIPCPHCNEELLRLGLVAPPDVAAMVGGGPNLDHDAKGYFMTCPHCAQRVDIDVTSSHGSGARLRVRR